MNTHRQKCSYIRVVYTRDYNKMMIHLINLIHQFDQFDDYNKIMIHLINLIHQFDQFDDYNKIMIHLINTQNSIKYTVCVIANYGK